MIQRTLTFIGLLILTLLIFIGVLFMGLFYDQVGIIKLPDTVKAALVWRPQPVTIRVESQPVGTAVWSNPLESLPVWTPEVRSLVPPTPLPTETPWPTPTPVPPLDPAVYRTEVMLRLKSLVSDLERWIELNEQLGGDWALLDDPTWQEQMHSSLRKIRAGGRAIGDVTPAPEAYAGIQALLEQVGAQAEAIGEHYALAMETREPSRFTAAGESYQRLKAYLGEAVKAMLEAGWTIQ